MIGELIEFILYLPFAFFSPEERLKRKINTLDLNSSGEFEEGKLYKVIGSVAPLKTPLVSPLNKKECVLYDTVVNQVDFNGTEQVIKDRKGREFMIEGANYKCLVKLKGSNINLKRKNYRDTGLLNSLDTDLANYLSQHRVDDKSFGLNKSFQFEEGSVSPGEEILIFGMGKWVTMDGNDQRIFQFRTFNRQQLYVSNLFNNKKKL